MSTKSAPWINLTPDRPGLDAEGRDTINEWCGVVGKQEKHRRHHQRNILFPSRAVNWKNQKRSKSGSAIVANVTKNAGEQESSGKSTSVRRSKPDNSNARKATGTINPSKAVSQPEILAPKKKGSSSTESDHDGTDPSDQHATILWRDGSMGVRVDPFDSVPGTREDPRQGEILDYYMQILDPGVVATFFVFDMRSTYGKMPLECLVDEEFRPLGLASIAGTMSSVRHAAVNREYVFAQLGKGMRQLRQRLSRPGGAEGDIILISVMFLAATAYVTGDLEGFEVHRKSLQQLVALRGGLDKLGYDGGTKTVLLQWASSWKLSTGRNLWVDERPRNEPVYPPIPLSGPNLALVKLLPLGFRELCTKGLICVELMHALSRMKTAMSYGSARSIPYDQKIGQLDDYLSISSLQILLTADVSDSGSPQILEALLTLGLILFSSTAFNDMRATPVLFRGPKDALYEHLLRPNAHMFDDDAQDQCYQWVWAVAVDAWRDASRELMPEGRQLLCQFYHRYSSKWTSSEDLEAMLRRFFWTEDLVKFHKQSFNVYRSTKLQDPSPGLT